MMNIYLFVEYLLDTLPVCSATECIGNWRPTQAMDCKILTSQVLIFLLFSLYFCPSVQNSRGWNIEGYKQVRPQWRLLGGESAVEGDRISPLESHWQPLEQIIIIIFYAPRCKELKG